MHRFILTTFALLALLVFSGGCGSSSDSESGSAAPESGSTSEPEPEPVELDVVVDKPSDGDTVRYPKVRVEGTVQPADADLRINNRSVNVDSDGSFSKAVNLEIGDNPINVRASVAGSTDRASEDLTVIRRRTPAEQRAFRAAQERKRQERIANLRANAQTIDPELLQKNPDKYAGTPVAITGEIFQIQEGGDNFLLMNTKCETEYDITICDGPTVHVVYGFDTDKTEDDLTTIYGIVEGGYEYDTQAGGTNYVASVKAQIIE
jgi:hypothetical protein